MLKEQDRIPESKQEEYILLHTMPYEKYYGWKSGDKLVRISRWLSGNGCGVRQAYFNRVDDGSREGVAWEDHLKPLTGQMEIEL